MEECLLDQYVLRGLICKDPLYSRRSAQRRALGYAYPECTTSRNGTVQSDNMCEEVGGSVRGAEERNTVGCVRTGSELRAGWVDHTPSVDAAGTVAKIDLRLPCPPCVRPPLLTPACPLISSPCDH